MIQVLSLLLVLLEEENVIRLNSGELISCIQCLSLDFFKIKEVPGVACQELSYHCLTVAKVGTLIWRFVD